MPHLRRFGKGPATVRSRYINRSKRRGCGPGLKPGGGLKTPPPRLPGKLARSGRMTIGATMYSPTFDAQDQLKLRHPKPRLRGGGGCGFRWFVAAGEGAGGDGKAVPEVDGADYEGQVDDFFFGEMLLQVGIDVVGGVSLRDKRDGLGPGEGGAFAVGEEGSLSPGFESVEALLGFSGGAGVDGMHVQAISTPVDLRGAHFDQMD